MSALEGAFDLVNAPDPRKYTGTMEDIPGTSLSASPKRTPRRRLSTGANSYAGRLPSGLKRTRSEISRPQTALMSSINGLVSCFSNPDFPFFGSSSVALCQKLPANGPISIRNATSKPPKGQHSRTEGLMKYQDVTKRKFEAKFRTIGSKFSRKPRKGQPIPRQHQDLQTKPAR